MNRLLIIIRRVIYIMLGLASIFGIVKKPEVTVLCYHSISNDGWRFSTKLEDFKKHIMFLLKHYDFISVDQLEKYLHGAYTPERPSILLTFDDGYKNIMQTVDFLQKYNIKPVVFVLGDAQNAHRKELDNNLEFLSVNEMKLLIKKGWSIGSHTKTHPDMLNEHTDIVEEINRSKKTMYIAYPKGKYSEKIINEVKKSGYKLGFSMDDAILTQSANQFALPRVGIDGAHSVVEFTVTILPLSILFRRFVRNKLKIVI